MREELIPNSPLMSNTIHWHGKTQLLASMVAINFDMIVHMFTINLLKAVAYFNVLHVFLLNSKCSFFSGIF